MDLRRLDGQGVDGFHLVVLRVNGGHARRQRPSEARARFGKCRGIRSGERKAVPLRRFRSAS
ncbi:hypothetical protein 2.3 [Burkholderia phage Bups phi1]|nr:hypothetical protein 2.3 [Burkholderia phage Bups phi1]